MSKKGENEVAAEVCQPGHRLIVRGALLQPRRVNRPEGRLTEARLLAAGRHDQGQVYIAVGGLYNLCARI
jgi:hypothetical protein